MRSDKTETRPEPNGQVPSRDGVDIVAAAQDAFATRYDEAVIEFGVLNSVERVLKLMYSQTKPLLDEHGLTYAGWQVIMVLSYAKGLKMPTVKLAHRIGIHPTTLTKTVDTLVRKGFVRRLQSPRDRRQVIVELTPEGNDVQSRITRVRVAERFGIRNVLPEELEQLIETLRKIRLGLGDLWQSDRSPPG